MNSVSKIAFGVALALGGASVVATSPALAQQKKKQEEQKAGPKLSKEERAALVPLQTAVTAKDWAAAQAALPAAQAAAQGPDARYLTAAMQLSIGLGTNNTALQAQAIDGMIASGGAPQESLAQLYKNQGALASNARDTKKAEAAYAKWVEYAPNDADAVVLLAEAKNSANKVNEAVPLFERAIQLKKASGAVPESWYKRGLKLAYDGKQPAQALKFTRDLLAAYPNQTNWRDALLIYRDISQLDPVASTDTMRLMRAAKALNGERDFFELADAANDRGLPGEAKAVLEEGVAARMVDPNKPAFKDLLAVVNRRVTEDKASLGGLEKGALAAATGTKALSAGDVYYGYGDYAKAASLYKAALSKGSVDANIANTRLGMALALSGNKAEAEAAFKAVTGPRAELAQFWLLWLAQRG